MDIIRKRDICLDILFTRIYNIRRGLKKMPSPYTRASFSFFPKISQGRKASP